MIYQFVHIIVQVEESCSNALIQQLLKKVKIFEFKRIVRIMGEIVTNYSVKPELKI